MSNNKIVLEKNLFINNSLTNINPVKNVNASKLCIYTDNDIECITGAELKIISELPSFRKNELCLSDACIDNESVQILNGTKAFELKSYDDDSSFKNKCIGIASLDAHQCTPSNITNSNAYQFKLESLAPVECDNYEYKSVNSYFKMRPGIDLSNINSLLINKFNKKLEANKPKKIYKSLHTSDIDEFVRPLE